MLTRFLRRIGYLVRQRQHDRDLRDEIEFHRSMLAGGSADGGAAVSRAMGNVTLAREDAREVWLGRAIQGVWRDAVYGARALRREPGFALVAILTLTLGVATTTTVFSVADSELWKPLPFSAADRLVVASSRGPGANGTYDYVSGADLLDWRAMAQGFEQIGAVGRRVRRVLGGDVAEFVSVLPVTSNLFSTLGWPVVAGRGFDAADEPDGAVALLGERGWQRLYGRNPGAIGQRVTLDGRPVTIAGVVKTIDGLGYTADFYVVIDPQSAEFRDRAARGVVNVIGRLGPGVSITSAEADLQAVASRIAREYSDGRADHRIQVTSLADYYAAKPQRIYFLLGASAIVLLLSCANVANLLLARALNRRREFAIRGALGGGTAALVRQLSVEGAVLAAPACAAGLLMTMWALVLLRTRFPAEYLLRGTQIPVDTRVAVFAIAVTALTAIVFGLVPVLFARRVDLNVTLGDGGRTASGAPGQRRLRDALLTMQVALTLILLAGAGLFLRSYVLLTHVPLGFDTDRRIALHLELSGPRYADNAQIRAYADDVVRRIRAVPGVADAAVASSAPLESGPLVWFSRADRQPPPAGEEPRGILRTMGPDYFRALNVPILRGRAFTGADGVGAPKVAIVNETFARTIFADEDPIGRAIDISPRTRTPWAEHLGRVTVVGVIRNVKQVDVHEIEFSELSLPFAQTPSPWMTVVVLGRLDARPLVPAVRDAAAGADRSLPVGTAVVLDDMVERSLRGARFNLLLVSSFASVALLMACVGIYGSMSRAVGERRREFGIRVALGAGRRVIVATALSQAIRVAVAGSAAGLFGVYAIARILGNALYLVPGKHGGMLYGIGMTDPLTIGTACGLLLALAIVASVIPARYAARVDPLIVLRAD